MSLLREVPGAAAYAMSFIFFQSLVLFTWSSCYTSLYNCKNDKYLKKYHHIAQHHMIITKYSIFFKC